MIKFDKFYLDNGLTVIVHTDSSTPIVAIDVLYNVGARDENPKKTGFAHLFEHLMFGGSKNIPNYDEPLEKVGGSNNAFTTNDITNYYLTVPKENIETGFWLESDRMLDLAFTPKSLEVQRNVVIEEFKQRYLNQPYGDVYLLLRPLAYKKHPYQWPTIGKDISHIEKATMDDVKAFYRKFYNPNNAILVVAGDVDTEGIKELANKWFGEIPRGEDIERKLPQEPPQTEKRTLAVERQVPADAIFMAYHMCGRKDKDYHAYDLISDMLSTGKSSRFHNRLVKGKKLFSRLDAYILGSFDPGLFIVSGHLNEGVTMEQAENAVKEELLHLKEELTDKELEKVKNKLATQFAFSELNVLNKAMSLAIHELLGDADNVNHELEKYYQIQKEDVVRVINEAFKDENLSVLYYYSKKR
ncbi:MAG: insulinase family protein [Bacteroidetes bacterium]|nr:MAG: insulinase family protein [Bacteroidota bacterium]